MVEKRELILFVPGMGGTERERYLSLLVGGIGHFFRMRAMPYEVAIEPGDAAVGRHRFRLAGPDGTRTIDVREAFWGDLRMPLSGEPQFAKIVRGFGLLGYWALAPRIWSMFAKSAFMAINMIVTTMLLLAWYWGAVASFLVAFGDARSLLGFDLPQTLQPYAAHVAEAGRWMGSWVVWSVATVLMSLLPANEVVDIAYASKAYLQNRRGVRERIDWRIRNELAAAYESGAYDRITLVAHSFGVIVAARVLADFRNPKQPALRFVTFGGALDFVAARERSLRDAVAAVLANNAVERWLDFYSDQDWLCSRSPVEETDAGAAKYEAHRIAATASLDDKLTGKSHSLYFDDMPTIEAVVC